MMIASHAPGAFPAQDPTQRSPTTTRVLLVEDEPAHVRIAERAFATRGGMEFQLSTAMSLAQARQAIEDFKPDLVIADVILPDGNGLELIAADPETSYGTVIMTAQGDEATAVQALQKGAIDYVVKSADTLVGLPEVAQRALRVRAHIQARRMAEERLKGEERRLRAVLEAIPDLIVVISKEGRFLECRGGRQLFGDEAAPGVLGKQLHDVVSPETLHSLQQTIADVLATSEIRKVVFQLTVGASPRFVDARVARYSDDAVLAIVRDVTEKHLIVSQMSTLSEREREVLRLVSSGSSNKQIAARLDLSIKTVEAHRSRLMRKLGARNMAELMQLAMAVKDEL